MGEPQKKRGPNFEISLGGSKMGGGGVGGEGRGDTNFDSNLVGENLEGNCNTYKKDIL